LRGRLTAPGQQAVSAQKPGGLTNPGGQKNKKPTGTLITSPRESSASSHELFCVFCALCRPGPPGALVQRDWLALGFFQGPMAAFPIQKTAFGFFCLKGGHNEVPPVGWTKPPRLAGRLQAISPVTLFFSLAKPHEIVGRIPTWREKNRRGGLPIH